MDYTINVRGRLMDLSRPQVMGILNATPDSFFAGSRMQTETAVARRAQQIVAEGGTIIDVGACSTRPDCQTASQEEEMARLRMALDVVRREQPQTVVSVDTFRPDVARMAVEEFGADIINDVGEGSAMEQAGDAAPMFSMVARLGVPYIYMSRSATLGDMLVDASRRIQQLRALGQKDVIFDPGFGFGKTLQQNYDLLSTMERLQALGLPVLVGLSRKSMIWRLLGTSADEALNGTTALHAVALLKGAAILRVHDVREAVECVRLIETLPQH